MRPCSCIVGFLRLHSLPLSGLCLWSSKMDLDSKCVWCQLRPKDSQYVDECSYRCEVARATYSLKYRIRSSKKSFASEQRSKKLKKKNKQRSVKHVTDCFYESRPWLELRYIAIRINGRTCMACGVLAKEVHVDHIKPRSHYPELALSLDNLQVLCKQCNLGKSNKFTDDWR